MTVGGINKVVTPPHEHIPKYKYLEQIKQANVHWKMTIE